MPGNRRGKRLITDGNIVEIRIQQKIYCIRVRREGNQAEACEQH